MDIVLILHLSNVVMGLVTIFISAIFQLKILMNLEQYPTTWEMTKKFYTSETWLKGYFTGLYVLALGILGLIMHGYLP